MIMNMMVMANFKILMVLYIKESGNNHCFMEKDTKLMNNSNTKVLTYKDIGLDMERSYI